LSSLYEVTTNSGESGKNFVSKDALLNFLGELRQLQFLGDHQLRAATDYQVMVKAGLQIDELPLPLRLPAWLSKEWQLTTGWKTWPLPR
jgi:hypothetical protein